jgi:hypothetical protein
LARPSHSGTSDCPWDRTSYLSAGSSDTNGPLTITFDNRLPTAYPGRQKRFYITIRYNDQQIFSGWLRTGNQMSFDTRCGDLIVKFFRYDILLAIQVSVFATGP